MFILGDINLLLDYTLLMKILNLQNIRIDCGTQSRVTIDQDAVGEYAESIKNGASFPPVLVYFDGVDYILADGFHRYHAHSKAGHASIEADVVNGTIRDAQLKATSVNALHGLRRTNADKRKAVLTLLDDFEWSEWSNSEIARHCSVSAPFVAGLRDGEKETVKYTTPTGKETTKAKAPGRPVEKEEKEEPVEDTEEGHLIEHLMQENESLTKRLALESMEATEEEKSLASSLIDELKEENRILKIELDSVKKSRDTYQAENAQMRNQIKMLMRKKDAN